MASRRQLLIDGQILRHQANPTADLRHARRADLLTVEGDPPGPAIDQASKAGEGAGLAGAIRAEQSEVLALGDGEVQGIDGASIAIVQAQALHRSERGRCGSCGHWREYRMG